jgi:hypothetical protein
MQEPGAILSPEAGDAADLKKMDEDVQNLLPELAHVAA